MARISSGQDFGRDVAQPRRLNESIVPNAAFGSTNALRNEGDALVRQGLQQEHDADMLRKQEAREAQQAREAADRAMAGARMGVLSDKLTDLVGEIDEGVQTGSIDKTRAAQEWQERSSRVVADGLPEIPEAHRENARVGLEGQAARMTSNVGKIVRKRDQADTLTGINGTLEYTQRLARENPEAAKQLMADTLDQLGPHAGLRPEQIAKTKQGWIEGAAYTRAFAAVSGARTDNRALATVEKAIGSNQELDPQRQAQLLAQIDGYRANNEARAIRQAQAGEVAAAKREREAGAAWNVLSGWALSGKAANPDANAALIGKLDGTPYAAAYKELAAEIPARAAAAMLPLDVQQQQLDGLTARRNASGTDRMLETEITRRQAVLAESRKDYGDDPLRAAAERGVIDRVQPLDMTSLEGIGTGMGARVAQAQAAATRTGKPVSPLLAEEAGRVGELLAVLPPAQRANRVAQIAGLLPQGMAQALAQQIDGKDKALGLAFTFAAERTTAGRLTSELVLKGGQARKDGTSTKGEKSPDVKAASWKAHAAAELDGVFDNPKNTAQIVDAAELLMHGMASEAGGRLSRSDMDRAVRLAIGGTLLEHNGRKIPLPAGVDEDQLGQRLRAVTPAEIGSATVRAGGVEISAAEFVKTLPGQQLMPVSKGRFAVLVGGRPVVKPDGEPVIVGVR